MHLNDETPEFHNRLILLLQNRVQVLMDAYVKSLPEGLWESDLDIIKTFYSLIFLAAFQLMLEILCRLAGFFVFFVKVFGLVVFLNFIFKTEIYTFS